MLYKPTTKDILHARKEIVEHVISIIKAQGFVLGPFSESHCGKYQGFGYFYELGRLHGSELQTISIDIIRDERWIQISLAIFKLDPVPTSIDDLKDVDCLKFCPRMYKAEKVRIDLDLPASRWRLLFFSKEYKLKRIFSRRGLKKDIIRMEKMIAKDFMNINQKIVLWHKHHTPILVKWENT